MIKSWLCRHTCHKFGKKNPVEPTVVALPWEHLFKIRVYQGSLYHKDGEWHHEQRWTNSYEASFHKYSVTANELCASICEGYESQVKHPKLVEQMGESSWQSPSLYRKVPGLEWRLEAWNRIVLFCFVGVLLVSLIWQAQAWFDCRLENLSAICAMDYCPVNIKVHGYFRLCTHVNPRGARNRDDVLNHDFKLRFSVFQRRKSMNIHGKELKKVWTTELIFM